ncbi:MAG TPA: AAA domain-containing protein, partial [Chitinophagaceae bacterium]|nr:AAA domain-containing protein [Chitinophagaceae bacterium]
MHPHIQNLLTCIELEEKEQANRYQLDQSHSLKQLKAEGLALHPIIVTRKNFGYADYPEISFKLNFPPETNLFKDGAAIECFLSSEESIKGILLSIDGRQGTFRLFAPDFPDWIEENGVGIKLAPDTRTTAIMKKVIKELEQNKQLEKLFEKIHQADADTTNNEPINFSSFDFQNKKLNESQQQAVGKVVQNNGITILHGPPGTGKTTTLAEAVLQLIKNGEKV